MKVSKLITLLQAQNPDADVFLPGSVGAEPEVFAWTAFDRYPVVTVRPGTPTPVNDALRCEYRDQFQGGSQ